MITFIQQIKFYSVLTCTSCGKVKKIETGQDLSGFEEKVLDMAEFLYRWKRGGWSAILQEQIIYCNDCVRVSEQSIQLYWKNLTIQQVE